MAEPRSIRRLAFQVLYQLDASRGAGDEIDVASLDGAASMTPGEHRRIRQLADGAYASRAAADAAVSEFAPEWPAHRQPAVDRAILRLAYYEMLAGKTPPKVAISEAVKLAESFSTKKSPAFVNAVLDKLFKKLDRLPPIETTPAGPAGSAGEA